MSALEKLKAAKNLDDVASMLGFLPKGLSFILYKLDEDQKYTKFPIEKKSGGVRTISAPVAQLALLQRRLGECLYQCVHELMQNNPKLWAASHGFQRKRTIISNAKVHRRRRFVFNTDIQDFFGAINFGRVRGYFIKDHSFSLQPAVATIVAQIACYENALPQGSPCSPVISNFIGNMLDLRLVTLAKRTSCTYTRYADDLTFSTNEQHFPAEIASHTEGSTWTAGKKLEQEVRRAGFLLNSGKTRMSLRRSRQTVTGLVVNKKVNISQDYYRRARAMCNSVFGSGTYYKPNGDHGEHRDYIDRLESLEGMLSHIHFVKARRDRSNKTNKLAKAAGELIVPEAPKALYGKFLFFKKFVALDMPLVVTEGPSDVTYLKCALRSLIANFPMLIASDGEKHKFLIGFLKSAGTTREILGIGQGAPGQATLVSQYSNRLAKYGHRPMNHPVIVLCDNDDGSTTVFKNARKKFEGEISKTTVESFYYLGDNLYLVAVPEGTPPADRDIEDLFPQEWLDVELDGKPFDRKKENGDINAYGKVVFAESVVRPNIDKIDFSGFTELLTRIEACIAHYKTATGLAGTSSIGSSGVVMSGLGES